MQLGANAFAARTPCQETTGCGFFQRNSPVGGAANGIPLNTTAPVAATPCTSPPVTLAVSTCAPAERLRVIRTAATHRRCFMMRPPVDSAPNRRARKPLEARDRDALLRHQLTHELLGFG